MRESINVESTFWWQQECPSYAVELKLALEVNGMKQRPYEG